MCDQVTLCQLNHRSCLYVFLVCFCNLCTKQFVLEFWQSCLLFALDGEHEKLTTLLLTEVITFYTETRALHDKTW